MEFKDLSKWMMLVVIYVLSHSASAVSYNQKQVGTLHSPDGRPCLFFTLDGVIEADPVLVPGTPWFSIPITAQYYKEAFSLLLAAQITDRTVDTDTTGIISCGKPEAGVVKLH